MIIYIHGFGGSGQGSKAKEFRKYLNTIGETFIAPSLSYVPELAIKTLEELIHSYKGEVYLIGSSLGGYYATYLSKMKEVKKVVLINPSVNPTDTLQRAIGDAPNFYDESFYSWDEKHLKMLDKFKVESTHIYLLLMQRGLVLLQKGDELLDYTEAVEKYDGIDQIVEEGGSHSFDGIEGHFETIREFFQIGDHFKHTCKVKDVGFELHKLANRVGDLYYDNLAEFLRELSHKLAQDSVADQERGRHKLYNALHECSTHLHAAANRIDDAWDICEIPTLRWMIKNGFNKSFDIPKMNNLPSDVMKWYYKEDITMPEHIIQEIKKYYFEEFEYLSNNGMMGIKADLFRCQGSVAQYFIDKYPEHENEIEAIVYHLHKV